MPTSLESSTQDEEGYSAVRWQSAANGLPTLDSVVAKARVPMVNGLQAGSRAFVRLNSDASYVMAGAAVSGDVASLLDNCAQTQWQAEFNAFVRGSDASIVKGRPPADILTGLIVPGPVREELVSAFARWDGHLRVANDGPVEGPDRVFDVERLSAQELGELNTITIIPDLPPWARRLPDRLCARTSDGWGQCTLLDAGGMSEPLPLEAYTASGTIADADLELYLGPLEVAVDHPDNKLAWRGRWNSDIGDQIDVRFAKGVDSAEDLRSRLAAGGPVFEVKP